MAHRCRRTGSGARRPGSRSGPGFYRLTVLDADGAAVQANVQVRAAP